MSRCTMIAALAAAGLAADTSTCQVLPGVFGYQVTGQNGTAGEFCWQFDCAVRPLNVVSGETLTLRVNAPFQNFFAIGAAFSATSCVPIPGIENALILDAPIVTIALGVVGQQSPMLACWGGFQTVALPLPNGLPVGLSFSTQAVAAVPTLGNSNGAAFSVAVQKTVQ